MAHYIWKQTNAPTQRNIAGGANSPRFFSLRFLHATLEQIQSAGEAHIAEAEAEARAAQILAEMLGVVCHEDYYKYGDQMISPSPFFSHLFSSNTLTRLGLRSPFIRPKSLYLLGYVPANVFTHDTQTRRV
jgi:hypothetical protein